MVVTGGKGVEGEAQGMKAGCERMESWGETWAQEGSSRGIQDGFPKCAVAERWAREWQGLTEGWDGRTCGLNDGTKPTVTSEVFVELASLKELSQAQPRSAL